jgi:hypothetical protein
MAIDPASVKFGNSSEWRTFAERRPLFLDRFENLRLALNAAYIRNFKDAGALESMLFFTSRQAADDFMEILLVCGNGEGTAGEKLLRSFYERVVTITYLHKFPDKFDAYFNYYHVTAKKVMDSERRMWGDDVYPPEKVKEVEANYERVKDAYRTRQCKSCGRKEMGGAWSPVALGDMAKLVGLDRYYHFAYSRPLLQAHPTVKGTLGRLVGNADGPISWGERIDQKKSDNVLLTAHALILHLFDVQIERFHVDGLQALAEKAAQDFKDIWSSAGGDSNAAVEVP